MSQEQQERGDAIPLRILRRPWVDDQQPKRSIRRLRKKKKSKIFQKEISKPSKNCRTGKHNKCYIPKKCPCRCHQYFLEKSTSKKGISKK